MAGSLSAAAVWSGSSVSSFRRWRRVIRIQETHRRKGRKCELQQGYGGHKITKRAVYPAEH